MNSTEFVQATAQALDETHRLVLADEGAVAVVWSIATEPDTIVVRTADDDVFAVKVTRLLDGKPWTAT